MSYDHYYPESFDHENTCKNCECIYDERNNESCPECTYSETQDLEEFQNEQAFDLFETLAQSLRP